jgi:peptide deformylase
MALDGYVIKLELPELREMISLLRRSSGNLNQIARRVNSTNRVYAEDMEDMMRQQQELWLCANKILKRLASLG